MWRWQEEGITSFGGGERPLLQAYKHLMREGRDGIVEGVARSAQLKSDEEGGTSGKE